MQDFFTKHRGWVIFLIVVPISFVYQLIQDLESWIYRTFLATNKMHDHRVKEIQTSVKEAFSQGLKMCTARAPWKTMSPKSATFKQGMARIGIPLRNILDLDEGSRTIRVEPMVTMGDITHYLVPRGYALAVQVEMDDLTVGGLCMGLGIETSSHRYGFLFETVMSFEIITATGELVRASREENTDLFHTLPASRGTLGFLVAVELEIVPIEKYVRLTYHPCQTLNEFSGLFKQLSESPQPPTFLEGLVYAGGKGVVMTGEFASSPSQGEPINSINRWHKPWFYSHVEQFLEGQGGVELIPVRHYFHRHTPSIFFQLRDLIPFANNAWYRWLFAWMGAPKVSLMKYSTTRKLRERSLRNRVAQDVIVPIDQLKNGLDLINAHFEIFPLWICPVRIYDHGSEQGLLPRPSNPLEERDYQLFVDLGVYGIPPAVARGEWNSVKTVRKLEKFTRDLHGIQMLYADIFMTREEFEEMYDHSLYREVRSKYQADQAFPEVYEKVIPEKWLIDIEAEVQALEETPKLVESDGP